LDVKAMRIIVYDGDGNLFSIYKYNINKT